MTHLAQLASLGSTLEGGDDVGSVLSEAAATLSEVLGTGDVALLVAGEDDPCAWSVVGRTAPFEAEQERFMVNDGPGSFRVSVTTLFDGLDEVGPLARLSPDDATSALVIPVGMYGRDPVGLILAFYAAPAQPGEADLRLAEAYARRIAEILERTRMQGGLRVLEARDDRRSRQLAALARAALDITHAPATDDVLRIVTEAAQEIVGTHQAVTSRLVHGWDDASTYISLSDKYQQYRTYEEVPKGLGVLNAVTRENKPLRLTGEQLARHPEFRGLRDAPGHPPLPNYLAAPLIGRDGTNLGLIQLSDKVDGGEFDAEDEAMLVQLAQMASGGIENVELLAAERAARERAEASARRRGLLAEAAKVFASTLDLKEVIEAVGLATVPASADLMVLVLTGEDGTVEKASVVHRSPARAAEIKRSLSRWPLRAEDPNGMGAVMRTGGSSLVRRVGDDVLRSVAHDDEHLAALRALGARSALIVPLRAAGRVLGSIALVREQGEPYGPDDLAFAEELAQRAGSAIQNARAYDTQRALKAQLQRTLDDLGLALEASQMGLWEWDVAADRVRWSETLERLYGFEPGSFPGTFEAYVERIHPDDRAQAVANIEDARRKAGRFTYQYRIVRTDGAVRWLEGAGQTLTDDDGTLTGMTGVCADITERKEAEDRLRHEHLVIEAVHRIGQAITSRLDLHEVVQMATDSATEITNAEFGAFFYNVQDDDGEAYMLYTLSGAPHEAFSRFPSPRATAIFQPTFRGDGIVRLDDVTKDPRFGKNPPFNGMPKGHLPVRSYLAVPVITSTGEVAGGMFLGNPEPGVFTETDERLAAGIAAQAAIAIENARLYRAAQQEIAARREAFEDRDHVARVLQESLLPPDLPNIPGVELAAVYRPGAEEVGGDFYDIFPVRGRDWGFVIGDVCGKGAEAATITALARHGARTAAMMERKPARVLALVNEALRRGGKEDRFCTALFGRLSVGARGAKLSIASGGHPPLLILRADGAVESLGPGGTLLGLFDQINASDRVVDLHLGDTILAYTDGVTEARQGSDVFGEQRLHALLASCAGLAPDQIADRIIEGARAHAGGGFTDDVAVLVMSVGRRQGGP